MRRGFVAALSACAAVAFFGYLFGVSEGRHQASLTYTQAWIDLNGQSSATSFLVATRALELMRQGDLAKSEETLLLFARLQSSPLGECRKSPSCVDLVGPLLPSAERLSSFEQAHAVSQAK